MNDSIPNTRQGWIKASFLKPEYILPIFMIASSLEHMGLYVKGYQLHLLPIGLFCALVIRNLKGLPLPSAVFLPLCAACIVLTAGIEDHFGLFTEHAFDESGPVTLFSVLLLAACSFSTWKMYKLRKPPRFSLLNAQTVWLLMAVGFLFLTLDEKTLIHENLDRILHKAAGVQETKLSDHLDDLIIGIYGLIGLGTLWLFRREILRYPACIAYLGVGFAFFFLHDMADMASYPAIRNWLSSPDALINLTEPQVNVIEEVSKLLSEACFLTAFFAAIRKELRSTHS